MPESFRARMRSGASLLGTFIKTPTSHAVEILGPLGFDFAVIDAEHAPFGPAELDRVLLGARAVGLPALVRVPDIGHCLQALDLGATGVLVPHVVSVRDAVAAVAACRYAAGRGFSGSTRSAGFGATGLARHMAAADDATVVIAQIEDADALDALDAIAAVDGLDGLFIGRADLAVSLGCATAAAPEVMAALDRIVAAARKAGLPVSVFAAGMAEAETLRRLGAAGVVLSSDQGLMRQAAMAVVAAAAPWRALVALSG